MVWKHDSKQQPWQQELYLKAHILKNSEEKDREEYSKVLISQHTCPNALCPSGRPHFLYIAKQHY